MREIRLKRAIERDQKQKNIKMSDVQPVVKE